MQHTKSRKLKIVNTHYTWHPDFNIDNQGKPVVLNTGKWIVEWVLKELNNPILEHYTAQFSNEKDAVNLVEKIKGISTEFSRYRAFYGNEEIFMLGKLTSEIDCIKKQLISKDPRSE